DLVGVPLQDLADLSLLSVREVELPGEVPEQPRRHGPAVVPPHLVGDQAAGEDARNREGRECSRDQDGPPNVLDTHESTPFTPANAEGAAKITLPPWSGSTSSRRPPG